MFSDGLFNDAEIMKVIGVVFGRLRHLLQGVVHDALVNEVMAQHDSNGKNPSGKEREQERQGTVNFVEKEKEDTK